MKKYIFFVSLVSLILTGCQNLDLNPVSSPSTEDWYASEDEILMSLRDLYRFDLWTQDNLTWTDDCTRRSETNDFIDGTLNGQNSDVITLWDTQYKLINRANSIILHSDRALSNGLSLTKYRQYVGEARFIRACAYSKLVTHFGDVPYIDNDLTIDEALTYSRTPEDSINNHIYADFDSAINVLPTSYTEDNRATKGAAMGFKARHALYIGDWQEAAKMAKAVIDLNAYSLCSSYDSLFLQGTKNAKEDIFVLPSSQALNQYVWVCHNYLPRTKGGWAYTTPSWELLASYLCTDGLPIDQSPLFDSHNPFKNRDPRCAATIVEFKSNFLGFGYDPSPKAKMLYDYDTGRYDIVNQDSRAFQKYASYNGLVFRKRIDKSWLDANDKAENDHIIMRLAEMYLTYAEAKIELNEIDQSVLDAINIVRARAYGVKKENIDKYPAVTTTDQSQLRKIVRIERRMELSWEGLRYMDLIRWKLADKALTRNNYGLLYPMSQIDMDDWFWAFSPNIDKDGLPDFSKLASAGKIQSLSERKWNDRQYLWPIPTKEIQINSNITQNPGY